MKTNIERAKDLLPSIILTVLSMIQALALELYWSEIKDSPFLWQGGVEAIIGWLQLLVMLLGILLIWVLYVSFMLRFTWLPALEDTLIPFLIGVLEFALIDLMGPELLSIWLPLFALIFTVVTVASHLTMRQARQDPANDYFFAQVSPASWRDYRDTIIVVVIFCIFGPVIWFFDNSALASITALLVALAALSYRFFQAKSYWMHSLENSPAEAVDKA